MMTDWCDTAVVTAEDGSLALLPQEQSTYMTLLRSRSRQVYACLGWRVHAGYVRMASRWFVISQPVGSFSQPRLRVLRRSKGRAQVYLILPSMFVPSTRITGSGDLVSNGRL